MFALKFNLLEKVMLWIYIVNSQEVTVAVHVSPFHSLSGQSETFTKNSKFLFTKA